MRDKCGFVDVVDAYIAGAGPLGQRVALLLVGLDARAPQLAGLGPEAQPLLGERAARRLAQCVAGEEQGGAVMPLRTNAFGVVLPRLRSGLQAREAASRILGTLACPYRPRIGIAIYPADGRDAPTLLRCAAAALADARRGQRPTYRFYLRALATSAASSSPLL